MVPLTDLIVMTGAGPDDNAAVIATANNFLDQIQSAAVNQFIKSRSSQ
jgi:hypothetical protein